MKNRKDTLALWVMLVFSGEIVVTLTSFLFADAWLGYWLGCQVVVAVASSFVAGMLLASKKDDKE